MSSVSEFSARVVLLLVMVKVCSRLPCLFWFMG